VKINCIHGYFKFSETREGQISRFLSRFGLEIERSSDHFTFKALLNAPEYSIEGGTFLGAPCIKTFAGPAWEVMRQNKLVYNVALGLVVPVASIVSPVKVQNAGNFLISSGMIQPGSILDESGARVTDYAAHFLFDLGNFRYTEVSYE
jgi:hypothetical protein